MARLPVDALARLQTAVTSPSQALAEVVANSLDAGATEVNVQLDLVAGLGFSAEDNGAGVAAPSWDCLGERHASSKTQAAAAPASVTLGFRGEALAAICGTSVVEITSRGRGSFETLHKLVRGGTTLKSGLAPEQRLRQGTVVTVRDLFFNQPVRRAALQRTGLHKEADRCREAVLQLALPRPNVTFTLYDRSRKAFLLRLLKGRAQLQTAVDVLGYPAASIATVAPAAASANAACSVSGFAALPPHGHANTSRQWCYVNGHYVRSPRISQLADGLFQQLFKPNAPLAFSGSEQLQSLQKASNRHAAFVLSLTCWPADCDVTSEPDKSGVEFRDWGVVLAAVESSLLVAWRPVLSDRLLRRLEAGAEQGVGPQAAQCTIAGMQPVVGSTQPQIPAAVHSSRGRTRQGPSTQPSLAGSKRPLASQLVCFGGGLDSQARVLQPQMQQHSAGGGLPAWPLAPLTLSNAGQHGGQHYSQQQVSPRNGTALAPFCSQDSLDPPTLSLPRSSVPISKRQQQQQQQSSQALCMVQLAEGERDLLQREEHFHRPVDRQPPASAPPQPKRARRYVHRNAAPSQLVTTLPAGVEAAGAQQVHSSLHQPANLAVRAAAGGNAPQSCQDTTPSFLQSGTALDEVFASWRKPRVLFPPMHAALDGGGSIASVESISAAAFATLKPAALTREQLSRARALQQVDGKFVPVVSGSVLALVDQHAADERVQLELLRAELVGLDSRVQHLGSLPLQLLQPLNLTVVEQELLETYEQKVAAWGWRWTMDSGSSSSEPGRANLTHVPAIFGTALTATDLKLHLLCLQETCGAAGLPAGVVRVLNSKACRSAIMFGDKLLPVQCQHLVDALKQTQQCFSCAHGRPTVAAVVDIQLLRQAVQLVQRGLQPVAEGRTSSKHRVAPARLRNKLQRELAEGK